VSSADYRLSFREARDVLGRRLAEPVPGRIQLLAGPPQAGKTTLLLEVAGRYDKAAIYAAADGPEAALPGFWERLWVRAEEVARAEGRRLETQFGRALKELGIEWIPAYSPQAKGRIERLGGTFQDRLRNELKLEEIRTLAAATEYLTKRFLPRYNGRFRCEPACPESAYRPAPSRGVRESILCWKESRVLARDHTFTLGAEAWQVLPSNRVPALTGRKVEVRRTLQGQVQAWYGQVRLDIRRAPPRSLRVSLKAAVPSDYPVRGRVRW